MGALLASLALPATGLANGFQCSFTQACIDRRPCFDSALEVEVHLLENSIALLVFANAPNRLARIEQTGVWTSFITDDDLDRVEVLDLGAGGRATLVAAQRRAPPKTISRTGICIPTGDLQ